MFILSKFRCLLTPLYTGLYYDAPVDVRILFNANISCVDTFILSYNIDGNDNLKDNLISFHDKYFYM